MVNPNNIIDQTLNKLTSIYPNTNNAYLVQCEENGKQFEATIPIDEAKFLLFLKHIVFPKLSKTEQEMLITGIEDLKHQSYCEGFDANEID